MELILRTLKHFFQHKSSDWRFKRIKNLTTLIFLGLLWNAHSQNDPLRVYDLKSEYLVNPIGLDVKTPRLAWKIKDQSNQCFG